jgi:signal transduction histidine kinase
VWVTLNYMDMEKVRLVIKDNGIGADHLNGGFGLRGLQERLNLLSGSLKITNLKDQGFTLEIEVPG